MDYVSLADTDLKVSRLCFGTMTFGGQVDEAESLRIVDRCLDEGINFFDTANVYTGGKSETLLGKTLKGRRDQVIVASKVFNKVGDGLDDAGLSCAAILKAIDKSLERLGMEYLDLYYLHAPDYKVPIEETLEAMDRLVRAGKVRYPASSNYAAWQVTRMLCIAEMESYRPARVTQPMYNLLARGIEQEYLPMAKELGVATVVYNPLAGGLLTGKQSAQAPIPGSRFDNNEMYLNRYWHSAYFEAVERLRAVAREEGRSLVSLALGWLLHHTQTDCVILGASRMEQLEENLKAAKEGPLSTEAIAGCDAVWASLRGVTPRYNR
jgi:aryl-alcohol dehydrogenase-like predicted oxidoreductase